MKLENLLNKVIQFQPEKKFILMKDAKEVLQLLMVIIQTSVHHYSFLVPSKYTQTQYDRDIKKP